MLVDTHTHIYFHEYYEPLVIKKKHEEIIVEQDDSPAGAVDRAVAEDVKMMILPNVDINSCKPILELHTARPGNTAVAPGLHPTEVTPEWEEHLKEIMEFFDKSGMRTVGIGEAGMDLYWDTKYEDIQMKAFERQCDMALERNLPLIIHSRNALPQTLEVLQGKKGIRGVFHCFGGTPEDVERIRRTGDFYFGIGGIVTFKKSPLLETVPVIGLDRILLETDAPYLSPEPKRGQRNESANIPFINAKVAEVLALTPERTAQSTTANAKDLFVV